MSALDRPTTESDCPFVRYSDVNVEHAEALWHFDNFDRHRDLARAHFGDASGTEFWMFTKMADIRSASTRS
jgi:hypothetical protein